jgi:hypothetical protein
MFSVPVFLLIQQSLSRCFRDWGEHIRIVNYAYDDSLASRYQVSPLLQRFLEAGPPPVYIGFGSMKLDDPDALMDTLVTAVKAAGTQPAES